MNTKPRLQPVILGLTGAALLMASVAQTHAGVIYSDDFATNPFTSRWSASTTGDYPLLWTGDSNPSGFNPPGLPANANAHSVYSFSNGARTMSTTATSVPVASADWNTMTYSVDFQMGGTGGNDNNYIEVLVNRSGNNGYKAGIYTGGSGHIAWDGDYPLTFTNPNVNVTADTWYRFKTTVTKSGADISMQSQILDLSNNVLATSPVQTFTSAAYTEPNGFQIKSSTGGYWDHAIQIDNFKVDAQKIVANDDFATDPFTTRWSKTNTDGNFDLQWTGSSDPSTFNPPGLPANANAHSVYSFSGGPRTMSTTDTSVPAASAGWGTMTYSLDFQMGGTGGTDNNYIEVLVNRSGNNGYKAAIYTGGGGHIAWDGDYPPTFTNPNVNVAADTWYKFKTTVTKSGADISMQSQILDLSGNILATSPVKTFLSATYTDPNGFKISLSNGGGYWDHATQIDNFVVTAALPDTITNDSFTTDPFASRWTKTTPEGSYEVVWTGDTTPNPTWATTLPVNANDNSVYSGARVTNAMSTVDTSVTAELSGWTAMNYSVDFRLGGVGGLGAPDNQVITVLVNRSGNNGYETGIFTGGDGDVAWIHNGVTQDFVENNPLLADSWYRYTATVVKSGANLAIRSKVLDANGNVLMTSPWFYEWGASYLNPNGFKISFGGIDYWTRATQINKFSASLSNEAFPGYNTWATTNAGGQTADLDWDNDGVSNGVEYFMNATAGFTNNPALVANTVSWPNGGNIPSSAYGTQYVVQTSSDLVTWDDVSEGNLADNGATLSYTVDPVNGPAKQFVRLKVTPY